MGAISVGLDPRTIANIGAALRHVREDDWDWLLVADGDERAGKSTLQAHVRYVADAAFREAVLTQDWVRCRAKLAWTFDAYTEAVRVALAGDVLQYEESAMLGRTAMSGLNVRMVRVMTTIGNHNVFNAWTFPDYHDLDPYLRKRARTRAYVHTVRGKRGHVTWWVRRRYPWPRPGGSTVWWVRAYSSCFGPFARLGPSEAEYWAKYEEWDDAEKARILAGDGDAEDPVRAVARRLREKGWSFRAIGEVVDRGKSAVAEWFSDSNLES